MGLLTSCFVLGGGSVFVHNDCPDGRVPLLSHCPGAMVDDESDRCIIVRNCMLMTSNRVLSRIFCWGGGGGS